MFRPACDPPIPDKETEYSDQIPLSEYLGRRADIMTMAVALTIRGHQAKQILRNNQADLNAVDRKILNNPNWPMDALKSGGGGVLTRP